MVSNILRIGYSMSAASKGHDSLRNLRSPSTVLRLCASKTTHSSAALERRFLWMELSNESTLTSNQLIYLYIDSSSVEIVLCQSIPMAKADVKEGLQLSSNNGDHSGCDTPIIQHRDRQPGTISTHIGVGIATFPDSGQNNECTCSVVNALSNAKLGAAVSRNNRSTPSLLCPLMQIGLV